MEIGIMYVYTAKEIGGGILFVVLYGGLWFFFAYFMYLLFGGIYHQIKEWKNKK